MSIPDYQTIMLPLLKLMGDRKEHHVREMINHLADEFQLTNEERRTLLPSGNDVMFDNKVKWARLYLGKAGLLESTKTGYWKITQSGLQVLSKNPHRINIKFLEQLPEYQEWKKTFAKEKKREFPGEIKPLGEQTPEEALEYGYSQMRSELAQQLLTQVKNASPKFFEKLVVELLVKMGYGGSIIDAARVVGGVGDEGIDGVIKEDRLGLDTIYVQAKKWEGTVGRTELMAFVGALEGKKANKKGIFITTSKFSGDAIDYISKIDSSVVLINGAELAEYMIDFHIGVSTVSTYEIQRLDSDYFVED